MESGVGLKVLTPAKAGYSSTSIEDTSDQANEKNVEVFKDLQKMEGVGLVLPVSEEHMYYAAMNNKSCRLTALGGHYWRLVDQKKI